MPRHSPPAVRFRLLALSTLRGAGLGALVGLAGGFLALCLLLVPEGLMDPELEVGGLALVLVVYGTIAMVTGAGIGAVGGGVVGAALCALHLAGVPGRVLPWTGAGGAALAVVLLVPPKLFRGFTPVLPQGVDDALQLLAAWVVPIVIGGVLAARHGHWVAQQGR